MSQEVCKDLLKNHIMVLERYIRYTKNFHLAVGPRTSN